MTMMVVDDDSLVTTLMSLSLDELGFHNIIVENSARDALARIDAGEIPRVIFCDLQMPGMDGVELVRNLASRQFSGGVILLSGADWRIVKACEQMGLSAGLNVWGHLKKPFTNDSIQELLSHAQTTHSKSSLTATPIGEDELKDAIRLGQIEAWYQPQVDVITRQPVGAEVLARWKHPERGYISPLAFITMAEKNGLIDDIMRKIVHDALKQLSVWRGLGMSIRMSINLSTRNLLDRRLPEQMIQWCEDAAVIPDGIVMEITESQLTTNMTLTQEVLTRLRLKGFGLSIDDFGTGYSSLAQLHQLPFTELKVDRVFVHGASKDASCRAIFESNVMLARKLGITSVAEGIETEDDLMLAREIGCDVAQGFLFSAALPALQIIPWLVENTRN